ncbi:hypothetical protein CYMTET_14603 [Cymbomonas tetramitiformis]|uniref:Uncharacterized protein n=1 Tax=Cymbomonas tetramitiformis TaxID=36881 RepID=A0AAE0L9U3_9CHLO|nr:hypothetical protein CYMTET_14603 [Cymbomonas tetramitiformis]
MHSTKKSAATTLYKVKPWARATDAFDGNFSTEFISGWLETIAAAGGGGWLGPTAAAGGDGRLGPTAAAGGDGRLGPTAAAGGGGRLVPTVAAGGGGRLGPMGTPSNSGGALPGATAWETLYAISVMNVFSSVAKASFIPLRAALCSSRRFCMAAAICIHNPL